MNKKKCKLLMAFIAILIVILGISAFWYIGGNDRDQVRNGQQQSVDSKGNFPDAEMYIQKIQTMEEMQKMLEKELENIQEEYENMQKEQEKSQRKIDILEKSNF